MGSAPVLRVYDPATAGGKGGGEEYKGEVVLGNREVSLAAAEARRVARARAEMKAQDASVYTYTPSSAEGAEAVGMEVEEEDGEKEVEKEAPKYIARLVAQAKAREAERERARERKLVRDLELEGDVGDTPVFVTSAWKDRLAMHDDLAPSAHPSSAHPSSTTTTTQPSLPSTSSSTSTSTTSQPPPPSTPSTPSTRVAAPPSMPSTPSTRVDAPAVVEKDKRVEEARERAVERFNRMLGAKGITHLQPVEQAP